MTIASNKKALHDYFIEEKFETGVALSGWEVKALRLGRGQLKDSYVKIITGEVWLLGLHIAPITTASTHVTVDPERFKKLLLHKREIAKLHIKVNRRGYSLVALDLHYVKGFIKATIALAKGKKIHDKRAVEREREDKKTVALANKFVALANKFNSKYIN